MTERGNPLLAVTQVTSQITSEQCWTRWTLTSEYPDCHILLWSKLRALVFEELVKKIENHPDRHALQLDLQQNKAYNPFSTTTKQMIQDVGNVELFELFETDPKTQGTACLSYWSDGGRLLHMRASVERKCKATRGVIQDTLDLLSIPNYVIKKGRPHGHRHGKTPEREYHQAHNLEKEMHQEGLSRDRRSASWKILNFMHPSSNMIAIKRSVSKWTSLRTRISHTTWSKKNIFDKNRIGWISLNKSRNTGPLRNRSDFNEALSTLRRLHQESGERQLTPMPFWKCQRGSWWSS